MSIGIAQVYDFEYDAVGGSAAMLTLTEGTATVAAADGGQALQSSAAGRATLDLFPTDGTDYSVSWKQVAGDAGVVLRGGYLFRTEGTKVSIVADGETLAESDKADGMLYFRGTLLGSKLYLDGSADGESWTNLASAEDVRYAAGSTSLVWDGAMTVDDIRLYRTGLTVSQTDLEDITMAEGGTNAVIRSVDINGADLLGDVELSLAGDAFEISLDSLGEYSDALAIDADEFTADGEAIRVFVRLKPELGVADYAGTLSISTKYQDGRTVTLEGSVTPGVATLLYDFESDAASSLATNPPAEGISRGTGNLCTAGVSNYTDMDGHQSKMLRVYSAQSANGTGVLNLDKFTRKATDYSVTWRQVQMVNASYKTGVILRADTAMVGDAGQGYTPGIMGGYYMNVQTDGKTASFRVYESTDSKQLNNVASVTIDDFPVSPRQSVWYRASVSGSSLVKLKIEYSTDGGVTWKEGISATQEGGRFQSGATQFVWGLASSQGNFLVDDITFEGITYDESMTTGIRMLPDGKAVVEREEYFDLSGRRVVPGRGTKGLVIRRSYLSDGTVKTDKLLME